MNLHRAIVTFTSRNYWPSTYVQLRAFEHVRCMEPVVIYHPANDPPPEVFKRYAELRTIDDAIGEDATINRQYHRTSVLLNCGIREVLVMGSDVYPCRNPAPCFDTLSPGGICLRPKTAIFWRDIPLGWAFEPHIYDLPPEAVESTFTPQGDTILLDTVMCRKGIQLVDWFNRREHYYFPFGCGDQTQWRAAWALLGWEQLSYTTDCVDWSRYYMFIHQGPDGAPMFVHRTGCKFAPDGTFPLPLRRFDDAPLESQAWEWYGEFMSQHSPSAH